MEDLYKQFRPDGEPILILMQPEGIIDEPPGGEDILVTFRGYSMGRASRPSGIQAKHLKAWI